MKNPKSYISSRTHDETDEAKDQLLRKNPCGCGGVSLRSDFKERAGGGVNQPCHGFLGGVSAHESHVAPNPRIVLIYWDQYFTEPQRP